ncbi:MULTISPECIES: CoA transferase [Caulobacter]|uniref:Putative acyl-CoA transferase/carnitine dehydratase n=1 Tax=Caulobacter vibrioides OR37 TaxID=1292034 RepID=R0ESN0_CAUVI|nr:MULTISPECIES: CoA transferase [Caulobacter]ENZ83987.1 putative acyl-CoA transferase/carnitine dehydratase [Caulobacter vibrioides OR37]MBQ1562376.1 CoA transferase [Caulobacter sp.]
MSGVDRPLSGIRIIDLVRGPLAATTRYLAELGASVTRLDDGETEPSLDDLTANIGKARAASLTDGLLESADAIVFDAAGAVDVEALRRRRPALVTMAVSDFGTDTRFSSWKGSDLVLHALSAELSRSGIAGRPPLPPPGQLAYQCAASQAAYALTVSLYHALRTGKGDHLDFSALDGAVQALDPGYGINGSATLGKPAHLLPRDRPPKGFQYPILPCADGHVRICLLAKRQWQGMFRWMGSPAAFASPEFEKVGVRYKSPDLIPAIAAFFADRGRADLEREGQAHGVPISAVLTLPEFMASDHVAAREALIEIDGAKLPNGVVTIDGARMGPSLVAPRAQTWPAPVAAGRRAFEGLKVLDLGVIVVGAEQGRLLADQGAEVVKVESRAFPDGSRQSYLSYGLSVSFAAGHRNKRGLGLNLRDPRGRALFLEMAAKADVILSNFKPGVMESLGIDHATISKINPRIIMSDSSAFGATGPWAERMGYGPLVRAATGLTTAWRYDDDPESFSDSITIYPDHVAGRIGAMAVTALLIRRLRTGRGGSASVAQSEVMLNHFAVDVARASLGRTEAAAGWRDAVFPAAGDDEWCVVSAPSEPARRALRAVVGGDDQASVGAWIAARTADEAMHELQAAGVAAARMLRVSELPDFAYFRERDFYRVERHPYLAEPVVAERNHARGAALDDALSAPAPLAGEHTKALVGAWLGLSEVEVEALVDAGVLEPLEPQILASATAAIQGEGDPKVA